jgi:hypothetical protein
MHALTRTARMTGLFYLGMAITGVLGFLIVRPRLFAADDPNATLANLVTHGSLAALVLPWSWAWSSPRPSPPSGSIACSAP